MDAIFEFVGDFISGIIEPWIAKVLRKFKKK